MRVLIIALPRTGSTSLLYNISKERELRPIFEPFNKKNFKYKFSVDTKNIVVKSIVGQHSCNFNLVKDFDEVILLSRKDHDKHVESLSYLYYNIPFGYNSNNHYSYQTPPLEIIKKAQKRIKEMNAELETLSKHLNIPIQYYEDLFDPNSTDRLRVDLINKKNII